MDEPGKAERGRVVLLALPVLVLRSTLWEVMSWLGGVEAASFWARAREKESRGLEDGSLEWLCERRRLWLRGGVFGSGTSGGAVIIDVRVLLDRLLWSGHSASDLLSS